MTDFSAMSIGDSSNVAEIVTMIRSPVGLCFKVKYCSYTLNIMQASSLSLVYGNNWEKDLQLEGETNQAVHRFDSLTVPRTLADARQPLLSAPIG